MDRAGLLESLTKIQDIAEKINQRRVDHHSIIIASHAFTDL
jgi:hypothetical protein